MEYVIIFAILITWCTLHSVMISVSVTGYIRKRFGHMFRFYRLLFNVVSIATIIPVVMYIYHSQTEPVFCWDGYMRSVQVFLLGISAILYILGSRRYDAWQFIGIKQIREERREDGVSTDGQLVTSGVMGVVRHPWYLATIILIWSRQMDVSAILVNIILTSYIVIGTYLEEIKLVGEFGDTYIAYQSKVSMLIPYKWLHSKLL